MKFLLLLSVFLPATSFAISDEDLVKVCEEKGKEKVVAQSHAYGCVADMNTFDVLEIDNRWYNPSKYIWYEARCQDENDVITVSKMVQYYRGKCL
jgi:hypothetical protein